MTLKNLTMTLDEGRIMTWRLPDFSALLMALSASLRTDVLTMFADLDSQGEAGLRYLESRAKDVSRDWILRLVEHEECPRAG